MLILLYGPDTFRSRQHLKKIIVKFKKDRDPQGLNVAVVDCGRVASPGAIMEQVLATPFLAERRLVVLEGLLASKHQELRAELCQRIEEKRLPESNVIVFWEETDSFKSKTAKELAERLIKEKYSQKFEEWKGVKLGGWIMAEVKERGGRIAADATRYLVDNVGSDTWRLSALLDQLVAYKISPPVKGEAEGVAASQEIQLADVQLFLDEKVDDNIFNLVDAIVGRQEKQAYKMIQTQYHLGEDAQYIFTMILRQFRILLELRDLFDREDAIQSDRLAERLGLHPFVVKKSLPLVRRYTLQQLQEVYRQLLDLDVGVKSGVGRAETLLDVFVGRVCAA